jgi:hypothetical protein
MSQPYTPPGVTLGPGVWIYVTAANNGQAITDASLTCTLAASYWNDSGNSPGWYYMFNGANTDFGVSAPNYNTAWFNTGSNQSMQVSISWAGAWPQTQTY